MILKQTRIGVFGGAFDPPHNAHIALAQVACTALALDALHIVPTGRAWHKARTLSAAEHRLAMAQLAFGGAPGVVVDDREIKRAGPTFTVDTLQAMQAENPSAQLYLIMGADQFAAFRQWHQWQVLLEIAIVCVAARSRINWSKDQFEGYNELQRRFIELPLPEMAVSATQIRQLLTGGSGTSLGENQATADLLPATVARYIAQHQLYQAPTL